MLVNKTEQFNKWKQTMNYDLDDGILWKIFDAMDEDDIK